MHLVHPFFIRKPSLALKVQEQPPETGQEGLFEVTRKGVSPNQFRAVCVVFFSRMTIYTSGIGSDASHAGTRGSRNLQ